MRNYVILSFMGLLLSVPSLAADVCEDYCDYLCRHYRQDLRPEAMVVQHMEWNGRRIPVLKMRIKNVGDVTANQSGENRALRVKVEGIGYRVGRIATPLAAGQSVWVNLGLVGRRALRHCQNVPVRIDTQRSFGQWGCNVYANDAKTLRVFHTGVPARLCALPRL